MSTDKSDDNTNNNATNMEEAIEDEWMVKIITIYFM